MARKTTNKQAKASSKGSDVVPGTAERPEAATDTSKTMQNAEPQNPEWWRNEGGSGEVQ